MRGIQLICADNAVVKKTYCQNLGDEGEKRKDNEVSSPGAKGSI